MQGSLKSFRRRNLLTSPPPPPSIPLGVGLKSIFPQMILKWAWFKLTFWKRVLFLSEIFHKGYLGKTIFSFLRPVGFIFNLFKIDLKLERWLENSKLSQSWQFYAHFTFLVGWGKGCVRLGVWMEKLRIKLRIVWDWIVIELGKSLPSFNYLLMC